MNNLDLLRPSYVFAKVVELGSFRAAANELRISPAYVSQMISELEERLGQQLLFRSTRKLSLTEAGEVYLPHAQQLSEAFFTGITAIEGAKQRQTGRLRITAPTVLAGQTLAKILQKFHQSYPHILLEFTLDDAIIDPVDAKIDLSIRIGDPGDDPRLARKIFDTNGKIYCSFDTNRKISSLDELTNCLWIRTPAMSESFTISDENGNLKQITPRYQIVINNAELIRHTLLETQGFAIFPEFAINGSNWSNALDTPFPRASTPKVPAYALFTERRTHLSIARAFVDLLGEEYSSKCVKKHS